MEKYVKFDLEDLFFNYQTKKNIFKRLQRRTKSAALASILKEFYGTEYKGMDHKAWESDAELILKLLGYIRLGAK
jgi:hypothetical protein